MARPRPTRHGPQCPYCDARLSQVTTTNPRADGTVYRRRWCKACQGRFTTYEEVALPGNGYINVHKPQKPKPTRPE